MPIAMRNMAISQQRDMERFRHVRGNKYDGPKAKFVVGEFVMLQRKKSHTLQPEVRPHILRIKELRKAGVVILQGRDGITISHQTSQIARCSVPVAYKKIYRNYTFGPSQCTVRNAAIDRKRESWCFVISAIKDFIQNVCCGRYSNIFVY